MRDISPSLVQRQSKSRRRSRLNTLIILLACCLLPLSACSSKNNLSSVDTANHVQSLLVQKRAVVSAQLKAQGQLQLETFQLWIGLMQQYQGQTSTYQQELLSDQKALSTARSDSAYQSALQTLDKHTADIKIPALKNEGGHLEQQLAQAATDWGKDHTYHDTYNDTTYHLGYEYGSDGVDGIAQDDLSGAKTIADYQQAIEEANSFLTNFQAYQTNVSDTTSWDKPHQTDTQLMKHYQLLGQKVVVVSLSEQTMRVYDKGKLVKAFRVTTGRPEKPSLPGSWQVESKQSPTVFKSDEPKGSPYWYPDTPISYAMLYHSGGYFLHDSWWRSDYGPDTQYPHVDSSGDSFSFDGSHGCVNIATADAAWLYSFVDVGTHVLVY